MKRKLLIFTVFFILMIAFSVSAEASCRVVSLMYHNITEDSSRWDDYTVPPSVFEEDLRYFLDRGYITLTAPELINEDMANLNGKKILLVTLDDGYAGWYTYVYPILQKYNAKATMFIVGSSIDRYGYLTKSQIHEMANCGLIEIGNHTDRIHQTPLERVKMLYGGEYTFWDVVGDIRSNGELLESVTGKYVSSIAWPYGYYTDSLDKTVKSELGYVISFSTNYGVNTYSGYAPKPFNRINREYSITTEELYQRAERGFR